MQRPMLAAAETFVAALRRLYEDGVPELERWERCRELLKELITDPEIKAHAQAWPVTGFNPKTDKVSNLLFYEDPDYGFTFQATVRKPNLITSVHDHGEVWTLYGLIEGHETMYRYERIDGGNKDTGPATLKLLGTDKLGPGDVDVVPPGKIHQEHAGPMQSYAFIVRGQRSGTFKQHWYELDSGKVIVTDGPTLIPFALN